MALLQLDPIHAPEPDNLPSAVALDGQPPGPVIHLLKVDVASLGQYLVERLARVPQDVNECMLSGGLDQGGFSLSGFNSLG